MKLSDCKLGAIVTKTNKFDQYERYEIGHIVGLKRVFYTNGRNRDDYYIAPLVKFADSEEAIPVHINNLELVGN